MKKKLPTLPGPIHTIEAAVAFLGGDHVTYCRAVLGDSDQRLSRKGVTISVTVATTSKGKQYIS